MRGAIRTLAALAALGMALPAAAQQQAGALINTPAEKFITAPGGVDMRTKTTS